MSYEFVLRIGTFLLFIGRIVYWFVTEVQANKEKPKLRTLTISALIKRGITSGFIVLILLQLLGLSLFQFAPQIYLQSFGFLLVVVSIWISINARITLGTNWTHAAEYQIKQNHSLVTSGIYRHIRHPIYTGMWLSYIGAELVVRSYVVLPFFLLVFAGYLQAKAEEKILLRQFGKQYAAYMKKTKRFIPYLF
jgi:protein-S-isoprenylcysteine O-methyltransferase Ste14